MFFDRLDSRRAFIRDSSRVPNNWICLVLALSIGASTATVPTSAKLWLGLSFGYKLD
jgi:hypothetical protein